MANRAQKPVITDEEGKKFLSILRGLLPEHESIASAVPAAFIILKNENRAWPHDERTLRQFVTGLYGDQTRELLALCKNQISIPTPYSHLKPRTQQLYENAEKRASFITDASAGMSRPQIALKYGIEMNLIPLVLTECVRTEHSNGRVDNSWPRNGETTLKQLRRALDTVSQRCTAWVPLREFEIDPKSYTIHPPARRWPLAPTVEELDEFTTRQRMRRKPTADRDIPIMGSLSGAPPEELIPTRTGKRPPIARAVRHLRGDS